jgi:hypothetical protein
MNRLLNESARDGTPERDEKLKKFNETFRVQKFITRRATQTLRMIGEASPKKTVKQVVESPFRCQSVKR